tara:strand:+ start:755 stop:1261 length:507 start_codon:yes stop_codon:yes gene_type:complete
MRITDMPEFIDKANVLSVEIGTTLCDAIDLMKSKGVGSVIVTDQGKLAGIFTERDLLNRVAGCRLELDQVKIEEVMTKDVKTAKSTDKILDSMRRMSQGRFRHLPIVDEEGRVTGLLSQGDFVALSMSDAWKRFTESAKAGILQSYQPFMIFAAVLVYTIVLLSFLSS